MPRVDDDAIEMRLEAVIDEVTEQDLREYFAHVEAANRVAEARAAEMGVSFGGGW
jgi:shikimate kinase